MNTLLGKKEDESLPYPEGSCRSEAGSAALLLCVMDINFLLSCPHLDAGGQLVHVLLSEFGQV